MKAPAVTALDGGAFPPAGRVFDLALTDLAAICADWLGPTLSRMSRAPLSPAGASVGLVVVVGQVGGAASGAVTDLQAMLA